MKRLDICGFWASRKTEQAASFSSDRSEDDGLSERLSIKYNTHQHTFRQHNTHMRTQTERATWRWMPRINVSISWHYGGTSAAKRSQAPLTWLSSNSKWLIIIHIRRLCLRVGSFKMPDNWQGGNMLKAGGGSLNVEVAVLCFLPWSLVIMPRICLIDFYTFIWISSVLDRRLIKK